MDHKRTKTLLDKLDPYTDEELSDLKKMAPEIAFNDGAVTLATLQFRTTIELIAAIRNFDKASSNLVEKTNRLTTWGLFVSCVSLIVSLIALCISIKIKF